MHFSSKGKTGKKTVIEDVEYDVEELTDSYFSKSATRVSGKIDHGKAGVFPLSTFLTLLIHLRRVFIVRSWRLTFGKYTHKKLVVCTVFPL